MQTLIEVWVAAVESLLRTIGHVIASMVTTSVKSYQIDQSMRGPRDEK